MAGSAGEVRGRWTTEGEQQRRSVPGDFEGIEARTLSSFGSPHLSGDGRRYIGLRLTRFGQVLIGFGLVFRRAGGFELHPGNFGVSDPLLLLGFLQFTQRGVALIVRGRRRGRPQMSRHRLQNADKERGP